MEHKQELEAHNERSEELVHLRRANARLREVVLVIRDSGLAHPLILESIRNVSGLLDGEEHG